MANMAGLVDVESFRASNTCQVGQHYKFSEEKKVKKKNRLKHKQRFFPPPILYTTVLQMNC